MIAAQICPMLWRAKYSEQSKIKEKILPPCSWMKVFSWLRCPQQSPAGPCLEVPSQSHTPSLQPPRARGWGRGGHCCSGQLWHCGDWIHSPSRSRGGIWGSGASAQVSTRCHSMVWDKSHRTGNNAKMFGFSFPSPVWLQAKWKPPGLLHKMNLTGL